MDKVFAWDHRRERVVYRIPGHRHDDGREDSDLSPVWLAAQPDDLPEGVAVEDLRRSTWMSSLMAARRVFAR